MYIIEWRGEELSKPRRLTATGSEYASGNDLWLPLLDLYHAPFLRFLKFMFNLTHLTFACNICP